MKNFLTTVSRLIFVLALALITLSSCGQIDLSELEYSGHLVTLRIHGFNQIPFPDATLKSSSRASSESSLSSPSTTHLDLALFNSDGTRVTKLNQTSTDASFGSPQIRIPEGSYTLVIIAHSCSGVATITSPSEVTFPSNKVTDTFYTCQTLTIDENTTSIDITLQRAVAMVRFIVTDTNIPSDVSQLKFYYTGGSSTFNPQTGFGSKQSKQTEYRILAEAPRDAQGQPIFEIYTFPHQTDDLLKITVTPQTAIITELTQYEHVFTDVPVTLNAISTHQGPLFDAGSSTVTITIDTDWSTITHEF